MKNLVWLTILFIITAMPIAYADHGLIDVKSNYSVVETLDRFEALVKKKSMTVFARIDHAAGAKNIGMDLSPATLLIFGNPKMGTLLMQSQITAAIDLPMKVLCWKDEKGVVWLSYNSAEYLFGRHDIQGLDPIKKKMTGALAKLTEIATGAEPVP